METTALPTTARPRLRGSKRLLAARGDAQLITFVRAGDSVAFEVLYERHLPGILSFCRHMLGSREEAEDAVQLAFVSAHESLLRDGRDIELKPWLYTIARNRCLSLLRARRDQPHREAEGSTAGLHDEVQRRSDLRELVADLQDLPDDQRAALVLTELRDLSHIEVAGVLGCEPAKVKGMVFRARSALLERRDAREAPCEEIRAELATVRGGGLRRGRLRHHLRACDSCAAFRDDLRRQRQMMALVLPVAPTIGLKQSVLGAVGLGGGAAGGGAAAGAGASASGAAAAGSTPAGAGAGAAAAAAPGLVAGGTAAGGAASAGAAAGGVVAGIAGPLVGSTVAKVAVLAVVAGGAGVAGAGVVGSDERPATRTPARDTSPSASRPQDRPRPPDPASGSPRAASDAPGSSSGRGIGRPSPGVRGDRNRPSGKAPDRGLGRSSEGGRGSGKGRAGGEADRAGGGARRGLEKRATTPSPTRQPETRGERQSPPRRDRGVPGRAPSPRSRRPDGPIVKPPGSKGQPEGLAPKTKNLPSPPAGIKERPGPR